MGGSFPSSLRLQCTVTVSDSRCWACLAVLAVGLPKSCRETNARIDCFVAPAGSWERTAAIIARWSIENPGADDAFPVGGCRYYAHRRARLIDHPKIGSVASSSDSEAEVR